MKNQKYEINKIKQEIKKHYKMMHKTVLEMTIKDFLYEPHYLTHPIHNQHNLENNQAVQEHLLTLIEMKKLKINEKDTLEKVIKGL